MRLWNFSLKHLLSPILNFGTNFKELFKTFGKRCSNENDWSLPICNILTENDVFSITGNEKILLGWKISSDYLLHSTTSEKVTFEFNLDYDPSATNEDYDGEYDYYRDDDVIEKGYEKCRNQCTARWLFGNFWFTFVTFAQ